MLKNKKIVLGIFVIALLLILPNVVNAEVKNAQETTKTTTGATVKWSYELDGNNAKNLKCTNKAEVTGGLTIPETIDDHSVISIGQEAFKDCTGLTAITLPDSVTTLGTYAFWNCNGLTDVTLSKNLTKLEPGTFIRCKSLVKIELPDKLTSIPKAAFANCFSLKYIKIPSSVKTIEDDAFSLWVNLTIYGESGSAAETHAKTKGIPFKSIENWEKDTEEIAPTVSKMYIKSSNIDSYLDASTGKYKIPKGVELSIVVQFNEKITGNTVPTLVIKCGSGENISLSNGTISETNIVYTYTIKEKDEGLITAVSFTGGNITDIAGNSAELSVQTITAENSTKDVFADGKNVAQDPPSNGGSNGGSSGGTSNGGSNGGSSGGTSNGGSNGGSSGGASNGGSSNGSGKTEDPTTATKDFPNTGKFLCATSALIIAVFGSVAFIRYKRLQIK